MNLSFNNLRGEMQFVEVLIEMDMRIGMFDVGETILSELDRRIPPPAGAWDSCCHMALGIMTKARGFEDIPTKNNDLLSMQFGMLDSGSSRFYHWAHEKGYVPHHTRPKGYFLGAVNAVKSELDSDPSEYFRRNRGVI